MKKVTFVSIIALRWKKLRLATHFKKWLNFIMHIQNGNI